MHPTSSPALENRGPAAGLLVAALLVLLTAPHWPALSAPLLGTDSPHWVAMAQVENVRELAELLGSPHFIGYRPLAALSFVPFSKPGQELWVHAVDLALLVACLATLYRVLRRVLGLSRGAGLLLVAGFALHPALEEVVPVPARRADLLVTWFSVGYLGACLSGAGALRRVPWLILAVASKEPGFALPLAALTFGVLEGEGSLGRRVRGALQRFAPDLAVLGVFAGLRLWVLGGPGGYTGGRIASDRPLIAVDYFTGMLVPHLPILSAWSAALAWGAGGLLVLVAILATGGRKWGAALLLVAAGALYTADLRGVVPFAGGEMVAAALACLGLLAAAWAARGAARLLTLVLCFDCALYTVNGFVWPRLLVLGLAVLMLWWGDRIARYGAPAAVLGAALLLLSAGLHLYSKPWERLRFVSATIDGYVDALVEEVKGLPAGHVHLLLADLPTSRLRSFYERRPNYSFPEEAQADDHRLILPSPQIATMAAPRLPDHLLRLTAIVRMVQRDLEATFQAVGPEPGEPGADPREIPERMVLTLRVQRCDVYAFVRLHGVPGPPPVTTPQGTVLSLDHVRPREERGVSRLLCTSAEGQKLFAHPRRLLVRTVEEPTD